jgi:hypothetical protein
VTSFDEPLRSTTARAAAELALVRVIHHYGETPSFVVLGGLVPALLCAGSSWRHAGTTDIDVQVDLEIATGSVDGPRLEKALRDAGFLPGDKDVWRWQTTIFGETKAEVTFDLLADQENFSANEILLFDGCDHLGAANLRGTGYAALDTEVRLLRAVDEGHTREVHVKMAGLAGFLLAKAAAAHGRGKPKDWYDIAFVLIHNDYGGVGAAVDRVLSVFPNALNGSGKTWLRELRANFADSDSQGVDAYVTQMILDHPELDPITLSGDARLAVSQFCEGLGVS